MRTKIPSNVVAVWLALALSSVVVVADNRTNERDWLIGKQIELYNYLLRGVGLAPV